MFTYEVDVRPDPKFCAALIRNLNRQFHNFREPLTEAVTEQLGPSIQHNFEVGGRPPFTPLDPKTIVKKGHDRPLIETEWLMNVVGRKARWNITRDHARFDNLPPTAKYGFYHQSGTTHMPARPWATLQEDDSLATHDILDDWVGTTIRTQLAAWR